ncbi:GNAT family N-acetyltransferase [Acaryochloris sp. CCMEE 5410]|uniref:GNAT family N-acetyltransferase n=1 Tax=Acaryochloris sp. CCMEE 5410 TaxID=310037 RepID=UPI0002484B66|nr:GNAT family N-acetyltransferase [Acaryochloris sp. CCMEE 5410]KAI9131620.1 GNAT family N-acetyltransferase [Acaryochloris sp. CCMEE 5410]
MLVEVSPLQAQDLADAVALDLQIFGGWWSLQGYQQELDRLSSTLLGLRVRRERSASTVPHDETSSSPPLVGIGCLWRVEDEAHITMLGIHPQYQSRGLGQALLTSLLALARLEQANRATLEVNVANSAAVKLYQKLGFKTAGRRPHYYDNGEDALILWQGSLQAPQFQQSLEEWQRDTEHRLARWGCTGLNLIWGEPKASS